MADPTGFQFSNLSTWMPAIVGGGLGIYTIARMFRKDRRDDHQERQVDDAVQQVIKTLRDEVARLTERVAAMEKEIVQLHEERKSLLGRLASAEAGVIQPPLFAVEPHR